MAEIDVSSKLSLERISTALGNHRITVTGIDHIEKDYLGANEVYTISTPDSQLILRVTNLSDPPPGAFFGGLQPLFGLNPIEQYDKQGEISEALQRELDLEIPQVLFTDISCSEIPRPFTVVERLDGKPPIATPELARELGRFLANFHEKSYDGFGTLPETGRPFNSTEQWKEKLSALVTNRKEKFSSNIPLPPEILQELEVLIVEAPTPERFTKIMPDIHWDQFLAEGDKLTALVDLDAVVVGPPELDLIAWELHLTDSPDLAACLREGYAELLPFPDLKESRRIYRAIHYLLASIGEQHSWASLEAPILL